MDHFVVIWIILYRTCCLFTRPRLAAPAGRRSAQVQAQLPLLGYARTPYGAERSRGTNYNVVEANVTHHIRGADVILLCEQDNVNCHNKSNTDKSLVKRLKEEWKERRENVG